MTTEEQEPCIKDGGHADEGSETKTSSDDNPVIRNNEDDDDDNNKGGDDDGGDNTEKSVLVLDTGKKEEENKKNGEIEGNHDYTRSNGVKKGESGDGGGDGVRQRKAKKQASDDNTTPMSPEELEQFIPEPPDGGWGWVIVVASLCNNLIVDGIGYTFGVFLIEFMDAFNASSSKVSLVGSLLCGTYLFAGPIVSAMTNKFGCRAVVIAGSIIATGAFLLATLSPNINMLICTYGVMGGFGLGMMYLPSIVSVGYYFQEKRAFATGLAVAGSGVGTFIFPPLSEFLLKIYNWRGALLIMAGIIFNGCVTGALMRPLEAKSKKVKAKKEANHPSKKRVWHRVQHYFCRSRSTEAQGEEIAAGVQEAKLQREKKLQETDSVLGSVPSVALHRLDSNVSGNKKASLVSSGPESPVPSSTEGSQPSSPQIIIEVEKEDGSKLMEDIIVLENPLKSDSVDCKEENNRSHASGKKSELAPLLKVPIRGGAAGGSGSGGGGHVLPPGCGGSRSNLYNLSSVRSLHLSKKDLAKDLARPLYRKDIFYSASLLNINQHQSQTDVTSYIASITTLPGERDMLDGQPAISKCINVCCACLPRSAKDVLSEMVDVSLFKDVSFMLICLGNFFAFLGFFVPFVFMVDKAVDSGIDKANGAFLISIIGITNTIGRIVVGKLVDHKIVDSLVVSYISIFLCGVVTALTPFCNAYGLLALNAALFGTGMAAFISLSSIIICDRMGVEKLTNAFGLMSMTRGLSGMVGPPLAGKLYDMTDSYNLSFFVAGFFLMLGAACHVLLHLPCLRDKTPGPLQSQTEIILEEIDPQDLELDLGPKEEPHVITLDEIASK